MSLESKFNAALTGDAQLIALIPAGRITFGRAPQGATTPFLYATRINTSPSSALDDSRPSSARLDNVLVQVTLYANGYASARAAADRVRTVLERSELQATLSNLQGIEEDDTRLYGFIIEFSCWDTSTSPDN